MAFQHAKSTVVLWDEFNLSGYFDDLKIMQDLDTAKTTTFGSAFKTILAGMKDGSLSASGLFDPLTGASDEVLAARLAASATPIITASREAMDAVGDRAELLTGMETKYEISGKVDSAVAVSVSVQANGGVDRGVVLHALEAETVDANEASVNNAAATTNGGVAHIHCTAFSGLTGCVNYIEHSTDDSTWVTLVTFANLTAVGKERVVVAAGTTVRQYLRARTDVTGSGSITYAAAFARRY